MLKMEFKCKCAMLVIHFSQFIAEKVKKNLRKSQAQLRGKLNKLRLRQKDGFLIKKIRVYKINKEFWILWRELNLDSQQQPQSNNNS